MEEITLIPSIYETRIRRQSPENQFIYQAWIKDFQKKGKTSLNPYQSTVSEFLDICVHCSILEVQFSTLAAFFEPLHHKPTSLTNKVNYLKNFIEFVSSHYEHSKWDFVTEDINCFLPDPIEVKKTKGGGKPLSFEDFCKLYAFFQTHIQEEKWLETYVIFRLIYTHNLDKSDIAKIDESTYNLSTGEFLKDDANDLILFDPELVTIFRDQSTTFLKFSNGTIYLKLKEIGKVLHRNITQEDIRATMDRFQIQCPRCGGLIENRVSLFGCLEIDLLNISGILVCKKCLGEMNENLI